MGRGRKGPFSLPQGAADVAVVIVAFPAQGHLNQMLHLSRLLAIHGLTVHFAGSATHNRQVRVRLNSWELGSYNILFDDLPLPPFSSPIPNPSSPVKFPSHLQPSFQAYLKLQSPLRSLLQTLSLSSRRVAVIHDSLMSFAAEEAALLPNGEAYVFHSVSAFALLQYLRAVSGAAALPLDGCFTAEFLDFIRQQHRRAPQPEGRIFNTCRALEGEFIDLLAQEPSLRCKNFFSCGPFNPTFTRPRHALTKWLDAQPPESVVYLSFGTTTTMSESQILEIASGLESSGQRFIWVLREPDRGDVFSGHNILAEDLEERMSGVGVVVRDWAPQPEILGHVSTALFVTHCGWNSCMESLCAGVPVAAWPMHSDQPKNAFLLTELLKVGVPMLDWRRREESVLASDVEATIRKLMDSEEGKEMRSRAKAVGAAVRSAARDAGASVEELRSLVTHITR